MAFVRQLPRKVQASSWITKERPESFPWALRMLQSSSDPVIKLILSEETFDK
jgi:hypothetical protein